MVCVFCLLWSMHINAHEWTVKHDNTHLEFSGLQNGKPFRGYFERFTADIVFDPNNVQESHVEVVIDMKSAKTGDQLRDSALQQDTWLYTAKYPYAYFVSEVFRRLSHDHYETMAVLTIRGQSQTVFLPFDLSITGDHARMSGMLTINRTDFGIGQGFWASGEIVSLPIRITVHLDAVVKQ